MKKKFLIPLSFIIFTQIVYAAQSWRQIADFSGSATTTTDYFTCNHAEWKLNYTVFSTSEYVSWFVSIYDNQSDFIETFNTLNGSTFIHNHEGTFYLKINTLFVESFQITVYEDSESISELPFPLIIFFLSGLFIALIISIQKSKHKLPSTYSTGIVPLGVF